MFTSVDLSPTPEFRWCGCHLQGFYLGLQQFAIYKTRLVDIFKNCPRGLREVRPGNPIRGPFLKVGGVFLRNWSDLRA
jgi:hypothetical protein